MADDPKPELEPTDDAVRELMLERGGRLVWARVHDARRPDRTGSVEVTKGSSPEVARELGHLKRRMAGKAGGRPPEQDARIAAIVAAAAELGTAATREKVAQRLGRVGEFGDLRSDYKQDVREAGGWQAIRRLAGL